jgi:hypothetical protein
VVIIGNVLVVQESIPSYFIIAIAVAIPGLVLLGTVMFALLRIWSRHQEKKIGISLNKAERSANVTDVRVL